MSSVSAVPASPPSERQLLETAEDVSHITSIFDPATLVKRGYCRVARGSDRKVDEHKMYYELHGSTDPKARKLVLIMGLSNSAFAWHAQLPYFSRLPNYSVLVFDHLGVGHSTSPSHPSLAFLTRYTTSEMAKDVQELLDFVRWTQEVRAGGEGGVECVGISMGGMVAQELALLIPSRIRTLLLTSTSPGSSSLLPSLPSRKATTLIVKQSLGLIKTPEEQIEGVVGTLFPKEWLEGIAGDGEEGEGRGRREVLIEEFLHRYHLNQRQPLSGRMGQTFAVLSHYVSFSRLTEIAKSVSRIAVIHGTEDELIAVERGRELAKGLPGSILTLIPSAGHALPRQFTKQYNEWIRTNIEREEWAFGP
ncbi:hypothetical protein JCM11641_002344 [Rhodosporidiobolus odoratus]